jgi:hypothetical protein
MNIQSCVSDTVHYLIVSSISLIHFPRISLETCQSIRSECRKRLSILQPNNSLYRAVPDFYQDPDYDAFGTRFLSDFINYVYRKIRLLVKFEIRIYFRLLGNVQVVYIL